jgi:hypothetical protein
MGFFFVHLSYFFDLCIKSFTLMSVMWYAMLACHKKSDLICDEIKFIYSEKATKFCEIFTLLLTVCNVVKNKVKISQNFVAFSEYINFNEFLKYYVLFIFFKQLSLPCLSVSVLYFKKKIRNRLREYSKIRNFVTYQITFLLTCQPH